MAVQQPHMGKQANPATTGDSIRHSEWLRVAPQLIDDYAEISGDLDFRHVDPEQAGGASAHGQLTLSLLPRMGRTSCHAPPGWPTW